MCRVAAMAVAALSVVVATVASFPVLRVADANEPLRRIGTARMPYTAKDVYWGSVGGVDVTGQRMYYLWLSSSAHLHMAEYDLTPAVPSLRRDADLGQGNVVNYDAYNTAFDYQGARAYQVQPQNVQVIDLRALKTVANWSLATTLPGFAAFGVTFSRQDGLLYLVGVFGDGDVQDDAGSLSRAVGIIALRPTDGALVWYRRINECAETMKNPKGGAFLERSALRRGLYLFCTNSAGYGRVQGQSALLRLDLPGRPASASTLDMAQEQVATFPISGAYHSDAVAGVAGLDPKTDRVFVQSLNQQTPGAFVFDGRLDAWLGQIPAPATDVNGYPNWRGLDTGTGRYYMATAGVGGCEATKSCRTYLVASDGRALPVRAGTEQFFSGTITGLLAVDPQTRRVFATYKPSGSSMTVIDVYRDTAPVAPPPDPADYDAGTSDAPETSSSYVYYNGSANGFGASVTAVGGTGSVVSFGGPLPIPLSVAPGTRGLMTARVSSVTLGPSGASASAASMVGDANTDQEFRNQTQQDWPYPMEVCLDGGGTATPPKATSGAGGDVTIECDLAHGQAKATASYGSFSAGALRMTSSSVTTSVTRDAKTGTRTVATAEARGIGIDAGPAGSISIASARTTATSGARGRSKTASASWTRTISGVVVRDATGVPTFTSAGCETTMAAGKRPGTDTCAPLVEQLNRIAPDRLRFTFPSADVTATPKGAFAGVGQTDADYYQEQTVDDQGVTFVADSVAQRPVPALRVVAYNDRTERSRLVLQLAAAEASAIYQVTPPQSQVIPLFPPPSTQAGTGSNGAGSGNQTVTLPGGVLPSANVDPNVPVALPGERLTGGLTGLLRRPLGEAALTAAVLGMFGTALLTVWRRHRLVTVLEGSQ